jgi:hypothetical protein
MHLTEIAGGDQSLAAIGEHPRTPPIPADQPPSGGVQQREPHVKAMEAQRVREGITRRSVVISQGAEDLLQLDQFLAHRCVGA